MTLGIGLIARRRGRGVREFFIAGASLPWFLLVPFILAEYISSGAMVGATEMAHGFGLQALWNPIAAPIGICLLVFGVATFYKRINKITLGEAFGVLFDSKTRLACVIFLFFTSGLASGGSVLATGAIIGPMFNIPYMSAVWISAAALCGLALLGLRGVAWMNGIHLVVILGCIIPVAVIVISAAGGLDHVFKSLPSEHLNLFRPGAQTVVAWFTGSVFYKVVSTIGVLAMFSAKDARNAKIGGVTAGIILFLFLMLPLVMGLCAYVVMPDVPSRLAFWEIAEYCGPVVAAMASIGALAAVVSTTPGFYLAMGALASRDFLLLIKPGTSESTQINFSRIVILLLGFGATWFALIQPTILQLSFRVMQLKVILGMILTISVLWRRIQPMSAFWTLILGGGTGLIWWFADLPFGIAPMYPMLAVGITTLIITSLIKRPSPFKGAEGLDLTLDTERGQQT